MREPIPGLPGAVTTDGIKGVLINPPHARAIVKTYLPWRSGVGARFEVPAGDFKGHYGVEWLVAEDLAAVELTILFNLADYSGAKVVGRLSRAVCS